MISEKICLKIKFERQKYGLSQEELALKSGLSRNAIWKIESGRVSPTITSLEKNCTSLRYGFCNPDRCFKKLICKSFWFEFLPQPTNLPHIGESGT